MLNESACFLIYILKSMLFLLAESYYRIPKNFYSEFRKTIYRKTISFTENLFRLPKNYLPKIFLPKNYFVYRKTIYRKSFYRKTISFTEKLFCLPKNFSVYRKSFSFTEKLFFVIIWIDFRITKKIFGKQNRFSVDEKDLDLIKRVNTCMIISINMLASMQNKLINDENE